MSDKFMKKLEEMLIMESDFENLPDLAVSKRGLLLNLPQDREEVEGYLQRLDAILSHPLRVASRTAGPANGARRLLDKLLNGEKMDVQQIYLLASIPSLIAAEERKLGEVPSEKTQSASEFFQSRDRSREAAEYNRQFDDLQSRDRSGEAAEYNRQFNDLQESLLGLKAAIKKATPAQKRKYLKMLKELKNG